MTSAAAACHRPTRATLAGARQGVTSAVAFSSRTTRYTVTGSAMFLTLLLAQMLEVEVQLALDLVVDVARDADPAGLGQALQTGGDVHAVAVDVVALDDDVADVDADPIENLTVLGHACVALPHGALELDGEAHRVDDAGELHQGAVAHELDGAAAVLRGLWLDELLAVGLERGERARLVLAHQAAIADHVGGEDRRQPTFLARFHRNHLPSRNAH